MAGFIAKDCIEQVRNTSDIISVIGDYTKLTRKSGNDWWGCCPFHNEKTASFHVDGDKKFYHCFSCHVSGDVIKFIMEQEKLSYVEAVTNLAKKSGIQLRYEEGYNPEEHKPDNRIPQYIDLYDRTASMFHYFLLESEQGKDALKYITDRGLNLETLKKFKLGYSPADRYWLKNFLLSKNYTEEFLKESGLFSQKYPKVCLYSDRLMFPIFNRDGKVVAFGGRILHPQGEHDSKYLNSPELIHYKKRETLYAFNFAKKAIREQKKVIFCEGYMDCIAYHMSEIEYAVAPLGTALTEEQIKLIRGFADTVLLSFDSDAAGQNATIRAIQMCRKQNLTVKVIQLKGGKDPAEILLNFGKENLTAQVNNAILDSDFILNMLGKKYPIETPEGKTKAALEYFSYVDVLQTSIQKESSLEQLSQAFNLKLEAIKRDFLNRRQAQERVTNRQGNNTTEQKTPLTLNAELRGLIAVTTDLAQFLNLRSNVTVNDFQNPYAKSLYELLESCYKDQSYSIPEILSRCQDQQLQRVLTETISSGVYKQEQLSKIVEDTIKFVQINKLTLRRQELVTQIRDFIVANEQDQQNLNQLLAEKMNLDKQIQQLKIQ
ncbi:MAG: DNA primase [Treponema sp.]|nr:DNA primase [Treponema sp.]